MPSKRRSAGSIRARSAGIGCLANGNTDDGLCPPCGYPGRWSFNVLVSSASFTGLVT
jgi:hypothetical protein